MPLLERRSFPCSFLLLLLLLLPLGGCELVAEPDDDDSTGSDDDDTVVDDDDTVVDDDDTVVDDDDSLDDDDSTGDDDDSQDDDDSTEVDLASAVIGPAGGTVGLPSGGSVDIPAGALDTDVTIELERLAPSSVAGLPVGVFLLGDWVYAVRPHGQVFNSAVTINLPYAGTADLIGTMRLDNESDPDWAPQSDFVDLVGSVDISTATFSVMSVVNNGGVWHCNPAQYNNQDGCDCGCGVVDPDCSSASVGECDWCKSAPIGTAPGSCAFDLCYSVNGNAGDACGTLVPGNNAICDFSINPQAACGVPTACFDGVQNNNETGIDCGGPDCVTCCSPGEQDNDGDGVCTPDCATAPACSANATCSDSTGTATCGCDSGYQDNDANGSCTADCASSPACNANASCSDATGTASCGCDAGYQDNDGDGTCEANCSTANLSCNANASCSDSTGLAECGCDAGYQDNDGDGTCEANCSTANLSCNANASCSDSTGLAECGCDAGYQDNDGDGYCEADCATAALSCGSNSTCSDSSGTADCGCDAGYQDNNGDGSCEADCATAALSCTTNASCGDSTGTAACGCDADYQDNDANTSCELSCSAASAPTCGTNASCFDYLGPATCGCQPGYVDQDGDGNCELGSQIGNCPATASNPSNTTPLSIIQVEPANGTTNNVPLAPITIYFDDKIDCTTLNDLSMAVTDTTAGAPLYGQWNEELSSVGNTVLHFTVAGGFPTNSTIQVTMVSTNGITDNGGNTLSSDYTFSFTTGVLPPAVTDFSFEDMLLTSWNTQGDVGIVSVPNGDITAIHGAYVLGLSSDDEGAPQLGATGAINSNYSRTSSGPIVVPPTATQLLFDYDFISAEFDQYVGSAYDDTFSAGISSSSRSTTVTIATVNGVGVAGSTLANFPLLTGSDSSDEEHTGWQVGTLNLAGHTGDVVLTFSVANVGDTGFATVVLVDNIRFQ
jgi:hypothetical protein